MRNWIKSHVFISYNGMLCMKKLQMPCYVRSLNLSLVKQKG